MLTAAAVVLTLADGGLVHGSRGAAEQYKDHLQAALFAEQRASRPLDGAGTAVLGQQVLQRKRATRELGAVLSACKLVPLLLRWQQQPQQDQDDKELLLLNVAVVAAMLLRLPGVALVRGTTHAVSIYEEEQVLRARSRDRRG